jgi:hypothetical protein
LVLNILGVDPTHETNGNWERVSEYLGDDLEERRYEPQSFALPNTVPQLAFFIVSTLSQILILFVLVNF